MDALSVTSLYVTWSSVAEPEDSSSQAREEQLLMRLYHMLRKRKRQGKMPKVSQQPGGLRTDSTTHTGTALPAPPTDECRTPS